MTATVSRVLLPTRFSAMSRYAAEYVRLLVPKLEARLHVVHIVPIATPMVDLGMSGLGMPTPELSHTEALSVAQQRLRAFADEALPELVDHAILHAAIGSVTADLIAYAVEQSIDLIIMGTHADGMLKRLVFGSVGKGVLEGAPCPVMLVPVRSVTR